MAIRKGNRNQYTMLPPVIEDYVGEDDIVRAYEVFIEALDFDNLGIKIDENKLGCPQYHPKAMLKLLIYGYSYGWRSSRKLERATHHNLSFIWLMGGLKPDHKTISRFRKNNLTALKKVLSQSAIMCINLGLIDGNTLFVDGSKMRGNASINKTYTQDGLERYLENVNTRIEEVLKEIEAVDEQEKDLDSMVKMEKKLKSRSTLKAKIEKTLATIKENELKKINLTDNECVTVKGRQGTHAGYNAQVTVDEKHGLIVNSDVVCENNDTNQFHNQISQANEVLDGKCKTACADAGYSNASNLKQTLDLGIDVVVPNTKQASHKPQKDNPFDKSNFEYDAEKDVYICPEEKVLVRQGRDNKKNTVHYRMRYKNDCLNCENYGVCTNAKRGRSVKRLDDEETKEFLAKVYDSDSGQSIYKKRKSKVELPFGHIKRNLKSGHFLVRGKDGAIAELSIVCSCFNVIRMINLLGGVQKFASEVTT